MSYWNKRPEGWLPRYKCNKLLTNLIMRPKWCHANENRHCEGCEFKGDYIDKKKKRETKDTLQIVDMRNSEHVLCVKCNRLFTIDSTKTLNKDDIFTSKYTDDICQHDCGVEFISRTQIFQVDGHIYPDIFAEDLVQPEKKWQDYCSKEQLQLIEQHLTTCKHCQKVVNESLCKEIEFNEFMNLIRERLQ